MDKPANRRVGRPPLPKKKKAMPPSKKKLAKKKPAKKKPPVRPQRPLAAAEDVRQKRRTSDKAYHQALIKIHYSP